MKNTFRRLAALMLTAALLISAALAEERTAILVLPIGDGHADLPVSIVTASDGTVYYWIDVRSLNPDEQQTLSAGSGALEVRDENGSVLYKADFAERGAGTVMNWPIAVYDAEVFPTCVFDAGIDC